MSKANSVSYNKIKQRFRKYLNAEGEDEMTYEKQLARWRLNPVEEKVVEKETEKEENEDEKPKKEAPKAAAEKPTAKEQEAK